MILKLIREKIKRRREEKDNIYYLNMKEHVLNCSDGELIKLDERFYDGMDMDKKMGEETPMIIHKVAELIEEEMAKRNLESCVELEEQRWLSGWGSNL